MVPSIVNHLTPVKLTKLIKPYGVTNTFIVPHNVTKNGGLENITITGHCSSFFVVLDFVLASVDSKLTLFLNSSDFR